MSHWLRLSLVALAAAPLAVAGAGAQDAAMSVRQDGAMTVPGGSAATPQLDQLIEQFDAGTPASADRVELDAWVEHSAQGGEVVVEVRPQGALKLVADPGIIVTPTARPGVTWLVPVPHRHVDPQIDYFAPPALIRMPFARSDDRPLELLVEYAYCVVDFQCFFGEETLIVALP